MAGRQERELPLGLMAEKTMFPKIMMVNYKSCTKINENLPHK